MYTYTWKKYLPVIKLLLKRSASADQSVALNRIDFETTTKLRKPACSFSVEIARTRFNTINKSIPARDLLSILQEDESTLQLLRSHQYAISLNSDFILSIRDITPVPEPATEIEADEK